MQFDTEFSTQFASALSFHVSEGMSKVRYFWGNILKFGHCVLLNAATEKVKVL